MHQTSNDAFHQPWNDGHHYFQPEQKDPKTGRKIPPAWTANVAIMAYWPVTLRNVWIVGHPDQHKSDIRPELATYNLGAIVCSSKYGKDQWKPPPGCDVNRDGRTDAGTELITADGVRIVGWPGPSFAGDLVTQGRGVTVGDAPVDVRRELKAIREDLLAERITARPPPAGRPPCGERRRDRCPCSRLFAGRASFLQRGFDTCGFQARLKHLQASGAPVNAEMQSISLLN